MSSPELHQEFEITLKMPQLQFAFVSDKLARPRSPPLLHRWSKMCKPQNKDRSPRLQLLDQIF